MSTVKTRILCISDTHTTFPSPSTDTTIAYRNPLPRADILLHAGDLTKLSRREEHTAMFNFLSSIDAELKLVIAGNHDITLDEGFYRTHRDSDYRLRQYTNPRRHDNISSSTTTSDDDDWKSSPEGSSIKALWTSPEARAAGIIYLDESERPRTFTLTRNGAEFTVWASPYTPQYGDWAFQYPRGAAEERYKDPGRFGINPDTGVDIMLTHGPPYGFLDEVANPWTVSSSFGQSAGCPGLRRFAAKVRPRLHVFGHIHEGFGAVRHDWGKGEERKEEEEGERIVPDMDAARRERCCKLDVSSDEERPLRHREETLFVNASVLSVRYRPENAPWLIDLDLPKASS
ncbi:hypothetical protein VTN31DRAFT_1982 [Thermomyces dupontii]|uniref:uncharacterized protein n=1 Tax=Talaromyces thermophilus TaxID=28565 RepID=UPI003742716C